MIWGYSDIQMSGCKDTTIRDIGAVSKDMKSLCKQLSPQVCLSTPSHVWPGCRDVWGIITRMTLAWFTHVTPYCTLAPNLRQIGCQINMAAQIKCKRCDFSSKQAGNLRSHIGWNTRKGQEAKMLPGNMAQLIVLTTFSHSTHQSWTRLSLSKLR